MKNPTYMTDEDRWQAVLARDPRADDQFVFAVQTTGIVCRPSCRARHALRKNVHFYPDVHHAIEAGFRPCKRCMPDKRDPQQQKLAKVEHACRLLEQDPALTLDGLAQQVAMSPFHFHRLFKSVTGMTPKPGSRRRAVNVCARRLPRGIPLPMPCWPQAFPTAAAIIVKPRMRWV